METAAREGFSLLSNLAARAGQPIGVHLQVSDRCNHRCQHCYQVQGRKGELSLDQIKAILDDLAEAGVLMLNISGGEATLRDDLLDILEYARDKGFAVRLFTNAYLIDDRLADALARARLLEVHVSVYSDRDEEHDAVTRVPGSLRRTLAGIQRLRDRGVRVVMKTPLLSVAPGAASRVEALAKSMGCAFKASSEITPAEDGSLEPQLVAASPRALIAEGVLKPWRPQPDDEARRREKLASSPCGVCRTSVAIMPNGEVRPCTDTVVPLGNLTKQRFADLYRTNPVTQFLREITWNDVHGCRDCDLLLACHRCHASASQEQGDYLGPYAAACARARARYEAAVGEIHILPPAEGCPPERNPEVGPYRIEGEGLLRPIPDRVSEVDNERRARFAWLRPDRQYLQRMTYGSTDGVVVPLRRSGVASRAALSVTSSLGTGKST